MRDRLPLYTGLRARYTLGSALLVYSTPCISQLSEQSRYERAPTFSTVDTKLLNFCR